MNDISYDLFYNAAAKILGNKPVFMPEELSSNKIQIYGIIDQSNHPEKTKNQAKSHLNNAINIRSKIIKNLSGYTSLSQPGTNDKLMFEEEKFLLKIINSINRLFAPAMQKIHISKSYNERFSLITDLNNQITSKIDDSLSNLEYLQLDKFKNILKPIFDKRIQDLKVKYLNSPINQNNKPSVPSGVANVPNLIGKETHEADNLLLNNKFKTNIIRKKSDKPINTVIDQNPKPGISKSFGSTITIYISSGR